MDFCKKKIDDAIGKIFLKAIKYYNTETAGSQLTQVNTMFPSESSYFKDFRRGKKRSFCTVIGTRSEERVWCV
jgi:lysozyme family protein